MKHLANIIVLVFLVLPIKLLSHCQVPCGIYDDAARIIQIKEDFETIKKAMFNIKDLSKKENPLSLNQLSRWVNAKENHATDIQNRINHYFLIQRIKPKKGKGYDSYATQTTLLHQVMVLAMKCKQTVDTKNVTEALSLLDKFVDSYFDDHGKDHIKQLEH